ncbi:hypothetical protein EDD85DRAFT_391333 [Armillaria nabsnona]|nr:hypothetical protein EDD85DRAFT_391333 [Armillaria nabsnona]
MVQKSKRWSFGSVFGRKKSKLSCPLKKRSETPLRNDLSTTGPRPTQLTAVETQKLLCDIYSKRTNEAAPPFLQRGLFVIFHDLLRMHTSDTFDLDDCEAADELLATFYGLDWKNVCDYLGLDSKKGDEQFQKTIITHVNLPESVQEEMHDMIGLSVRTSDRRHDYRHVMPVVTKSLLFFEGLLHTYISDKSCLDGATSGGFVDIMIRHQNKTILIFIILKQKFFLGHPSSELLAQVVAEMSGIFALNKKLGPPFPVYAIVSDLSQFFYYYYTGDEYISMGNFELPAKVDFDIETANSLTMTFVLSSFASDFFSILLEGFYFYSEDTAEHLRPLGGPALVRYNAATRVYQDDIIKTFRRMVPWSKRKGVTESQKAIGIAHTVLCHLGLTWIPENGRANRRGKLDLASIKGLMPAITMRYKVDDSNARVHLHAFETDADTGRTGLLMTWAEAEACHSFSLDSLTSCFDVGAKILISAILEMVQKIHPPYQAK